MTTQDESGKGYGQEHGGVHGNEARAATHDVGGQSLFQCESVTPDDDAPPDAFGKRVDALRSLLGAQKQLGTDELRRGVESIPREQYHRLQYYERWLHSLTAVLLEKGIVTEDELK